MLARVLRMSWLLLLALGIPYLSGLLYLLWQGDRAFFATSPPSYESCQWIELPDESRLAVRVERRDSSEWWLLYSHGSSGDLGLLEAKVEGWRRFGFNVVVYDYPGIGLSEGTISEKGCYSASLAVYHWMRHHFNVPSERIVLYGRSIGTAPTLYLAEREPCAGVLLVSPFTSALDVEWQTAPYRWVRRFANDRMIGNITAPMLVVHAGRDRIIPSRNVHKLMEVAPPQTRMVVIEEANHIDLDHQPAFWAAVSQFLRSTIRQLPATDSTGATSAHSAGS